jgi:hypothetical protein
MNGRTNTPPMTLIILLVAVIALALLLLWWAASSPEAEPIAAPLSFLTMLLAGPVVLYYLFLHGGRKAIETEVYKTPVFVLRGRAAVTAGQRLILAGRCFVIFCFSLVGMAVLYEWFRAP